jgi:hypothetical protein
MRWGSERCPPWPRGRSRGQRSSHHIRVAEVSWDLVAHPFDRVVLPASQLKRFSEDRQLSSVNAGTSTSVTESSGWC